LNYPPIQSAVIGQVAVALGNDGPPPHIPCPLSVKCFQGGGNAEDTKLTTAQKKTAETLYLELELLPGHVGIERLLIITLTFADPLPSRGCREAAWLKIRKHLLQKLFQFGVTISDRSRSGRPHFHVVVVGAEGVDFRTGFDFGAWDASRAAESKWHDSGHTDHTAETRWRAMTAKYAASAPSALRAEWYELSEAGGKFGFGRINAMPVKDPIAYARYLAGCITDGIRMDHPEDRGIHRVRYWGNFPRKVSPHFYRTTKGATRWRGQVSFCARVLGFDDQGDFKKCFGPRWFIFLKGIIRLVPASIAKASLLSPNLPLDLLAAYRRQLRQIETELLDRVERYGRQPQPIK